MKKILFIILAMFVAISFVLVCNANQIETDLGVSVREDSTDQAQEQKENTFASRLEEFWNEHSVEIISVLAELASAAVLVLTVLKKFKGSNKKLEISAAQSTAVYNSQKKLDASNKLVENAVEHINKAEERINAAEGVINRYIDASKNGLDQIVKLCANTQEMLVSISSRSNEIPSQVKDMIDAKYVESLKIAQSYFGTPSNTESACE